MKKTYTLLVSLFFTAAMFSQAPDKMSYQAVIRNSGGVLVANTQIGMEINIRQGSASGTIVYTETQTPTTNANGLVSIEIGGAGFSAINWGSNTYYIETKTAIVAPLTTYAISGTSQLLSVPYALYAKRSGEHYVGELYGGGVVFWVDQTGSHGLICSMIDNSTALIWTTAAFQSITVPASGALSDWNGQANTTAIVAQAEAGISYAAGLCDAYTNVDYGTGVYSDWYLPSRGELNHLWNNIYQVQKALDSDGNAATTAIIKTHYWSSSEYDNSDAWAFYSDSGGSSNTSKASTGCVRAVRAF
jgi:hypothetical protein